MTDHEDVPTRAEAERDAPFGESPLALAQEQAEAALRAIGASVIYRLRISPAPSAAPPLELVLSALAEETVRGAGNEATVMTAQRFAFDVLLAPARVPGIGGGVLPTIADAIVSAASESVHGHLRNIARELISEHEARADEDIPF